MEAQALINLLFVVAGGLGGFILRATWSALEAMRHDLQALQASMSETYVRRDDFRDSVDDLKEALSRIEDKLDGKVNR